MAKPRAKAKKLQASKTDGKSAEAAFIAGLVVRGEAVEPEEAESACATHIVLKKDAEGKVTEVKRQRFSAY